MSDGPATPGQELSRRTIRSELLIVLSLAFFASIGYALIQFFYDALHVPVSHPAIVNYQPPVFEPFGFASDVVGELVQFLPVVLVAHLLGRVGSSMRELGFDRTKPRRDVLFGTALAAIALAATIGGGALTRALGLPFRPIIPVNADANLAAIFLFVIASASAAVSEEVIINAYLITRLERLGWDPRWALVASAGLRGSYHLYQGLGGFVNNVLGGLVAGYVFQRTRRIMPLVVAHFLFDLIAFVGYLLLHDHLHFLTG